VKKSSWKSKLLKAIPIGLLVGILFFFLDTNFAHAGMGSCIPPGFNGGDCISSVFYYIIYFIGLIAGFFVAIILWVIQIILQFNQHVTDTTIVQTGFSVTLGIANLGFVLGIIIVALATILRRETYGIKNILWKIVVMAILANFALVIAAPIIGFANGLTSYFINSMPGGSNTAGSSGNYGGFSGFNNLSNGIAGIFQPQRLIAPENAGSGQQAGTTYGCVAGDQPNSIIACSASSTDSMPDATCRYATGCGGRACFSVPSMDCGSPANAKPSQMPTNNTSTTWGQAGASGLGAIIAGLIGLIMAVVTLILMIIVLIVLFVMLFIRYVYLIVLLIVAPFAWMSWVFPMTQKYWSQWWHKFIAQAFFPAIAMFFIWLVVTIGSNIVPGQSTMTMPVGNGVGGFIASIGNGLLGTIIGSALNSLLMIGLMMAGLMMASKMATEGSAIAGKVVGKVKDSVTGYATKKSKIYGRAAFRKAGGETLVKGMRTGSGQDLKGKRLLGIPGTRWMGTLAGKAIETRPGRMVSSNLGRAIQPHLSNKDIVDEAKKKVSDNPMEILENLKNAGMSKEDKIANLQKLMDKGMLEKVGNDDVMVGNMKARDFIDKSDKAGDLKNYGQGGMIFDANKAMASNGAMRDLERTITKLKEDGKSATEELRQLDIETEKYVKMLQKGDGAKINVNNVFGGKEPTFFTEALMKGMSKFAPHIISSILPKANKKALDVIEGSYKNVLMTEGVSDRYLDSRYPEQRDNIPDDIKRTFNTKLFYNALGNNALYGGAPEPAQATPAAPPPPPPATGATK
jgi:hypothetical protein